ncbi:hypothetical protein CC78DRAFT_568939 [Lojkania enalia]|uniref:Uncharacterized protein n=1 Tax=Lojkania enalia TaxID=147567 RepID=A0A9P4K697_9PLEO|nr:hypothetical protein CC78DRAFT_568939 [Didymosphaeria enalia]
MKVIEKDADRGAETHVFLVGSLDSLHEYDASFDSDNALACFIQVEKGKTFKVFAEFTGMTVSLLRNKLDCTDFLVQSADGILETECTISELPAARGGKKVNASIGTIEIHLQNHTLQTKLVNATSEHLNIELLGPEHEFPARVFSKLNTDPFPNIQSQWPAKMNEENIPASRAANGNYEARITPATSKSVDLPKESLVKQTVAGKKPDSPAALISTMTPTSAYQADAIPAKRPAQEPISPTVRRTKIIPRPSPSLKPTSLEQGVCEARKRLDKVKQNRKTLTKKKMEMKLKLEAFQKEMQEELERLMKEIEEEEKTMLEDKTELEHSQGV